MEALLGALADEVGTPLPGGDPLVPEMISVQGRGMERWLSMELSRRLGVWANPAFPFPRRLVERAFDTVLGPVNAAANGFDPEALRWSIAAVLPDLIEREEFAPLARSLSSDGSELRRLQLAARIADVFDRYVTYRPEMIRAWERGVHAGAPAWQLSLWQALVERLGSHHLAARADAFLAAIDAVPEARPLELPGLPARIHLFGVTTLPPLYVDVLAALSKRVEMHLYWLACTRVTAGAAEEGSPLWASFGAVGREFDEVLTDRASAERLQSFHDPGSETMLHALQRAILEGEGQPGAAARLSPADRSIQVHACYGPMREVEVLHDQLSALFESDPSLEPRDVVVMTPKIETYAPFIEAAFGSSARGAGERAHFGYRIADRGVRATHAIVDGFGRLLEALQGRLTASAVVDLLMVECLRARFGIEAGDLDVVTEWIEEAGIRWGADAGHRAEVGQPEVAQNTWREGLDRLLLAVALPREGDPLYQGHLPADGVDPSRVELLGRLVDFCEALFQSRLRLQGARTVRDWSQELARVLDAMVDRGGGSGGGAEQHARIRNALGDVARRAEDAGFGEAIDLQTVLHELHPRLEEGASSQRFLSGGVTFCEMVPMRSIPFRVVVLLGMDDESFPRSREPLGFDVTAWDRRPGDRTARDDDRYLFLEAIVSARDHLIVTYTGRSLRDGSVRAPSVVVNELLDELSARFAVDGGCTRDCVVRVHPRHAFSPRYFDSSDPTLVSFSRSDCEAARALQEALEAPDRAGAPFVREPFPDERDEGDEADEENLRVVELDRLARFFEHPVRAFLQERLGLYLRDEVPDLGDREPMELDGLESWKIGDQLLRHELADLSRERARALLRASGVLPLGAAGELEVDRSRAEVTKLADAVRGLRRDESRPAIPVDLELGGWRIVGELGDLWAAGRVVFQYSKVPHRAELNLWIRHLVLNCVAEGTAVDGPGRESFLVARDRGAAGISVIHLPPIDGAAEILADLLELYAQGRRAPLPVFPRASRVQADSGAKKDWPAGVASAAVAAFEVASGPLPAERSDPYLHQAFEDVDLLEGAPAPGGADFESLARRIWEPYLRAREDGA